MKPLNVAAVKWQLGCSGQKKHGGNNLEKRGDSICDCHAIIAQQRIQSPLAKAQSPEFLMKVASKHPIISVELDFLMKAQLKQFRPAALLRNSESDIFYFTDPLL